MDKNSHTVNHQTAGRVKAGQRRCVHGQKQPHCTSPYNLLQAESTQLYLIYPVTNLHLDLLQHFDGGTHLLCDETEPWFLPLLALTQATPTYLVTSLHFDFFQRTLGQHTPTRPQEAESVKERKVPNVCDFKNKNCTVGSCTCSLLQMTVLLWGHAFHFQTFLESKYMGITCEVIARNPLNGQHMKI